MKLYQYYEDCGRMGSLEGLFFSDEEEINNLKKYNLHWDELLGKHSEGRFSFNDETLSVVELPPEVLDTLYKALGKVISGDLDFEYFYEQIEEQKDNEVQK